MAPKSNSQTLCPREVLSEREEEREPGAEEREDDPRFDPDEPRSSQSPGAVRELPVPSSN